MSEEDYEVLGALGCFAGIDLLISIPLLIIGYNIHNDTLIVIGWIGIGIIILATVGVLNFLS
jgi:hypothetical protein